MSTIAGVLDRLGGPVADDVVARLTSAIEAAAPGRPHSVRVGPVTMVHSAVHIQHHKPFQRQPIAGDDETLLSFDGRIDEEGRGVTRRQCNEWDDARALLAAYRTTEIGGFAQLIGDFTFSLWDGARRCLVLGCDSVGRRPIYYVLTPRHVAWCSLARPLVDAGLASGEIDEQYVAAFLSSWTPDRGPFRGVGVLLGAQVLLVDGPDEEVRTYWRADPRTELRYASDREYEEHFSELFREAVASRLRADGPVWCELSGGVDSSSIACQADLLIREGSVAATDLVTASYVFEEAPTSDEREFIAPVEARLGRRAVHISERANPILAPLPAHFRPDLPTNALCYLMRQDELTRQMLAGNARVLLNGIGGDQMFWSEPPFGMQLADLLAQRRLPELLRSCTDLSREARSPYVRTFWRGAVRPLLPRAFLARTHYEHPLARWYRGDFLQRTALREKILSMPDAIGFALPSKRAQSGYLRQTMRPYALEWCSSAGHLDIRYPYLDRRIIEFALALPWDQAVRAGETRSIVRRATRGLLPDEVRLRKTKAGPHEALHRAVVKQWPRLSLLLAEPRLAAHGIVEAEPFRDALKAAHHGRISSPVQLVRSLALELWLRTLEGDSPGLVDGEAGPPGRRRLLQGVSYA